MLTVWVGVNTLNEELGLQKDHKLSEESTPMIFNIINGINVSI